MSLSQVRPDRVEPLWDRVDRNRVKLAFTVGVFLVGCVASVYVMLAAVLAVPALWALTEGVDPSDLGLWVPHLFVYAGLFAILAGTVWVSFALSRCERWMLRRLAAHPTATGELLPTKHALKDMAIAAGFPVAPALWVMETGNVNAFIFAHARRRAVVGVTRGLVERLTVDEQRAVFANLMARLRSGDTIWATGVTALMYPIWAIRDRHLELSGEQPLLGVSDGDGLPDVRAASYGSGAMWFLWFFVIGIAFVALTELLLAGHRGSQLRLAETADAEGMLLLKDPRSMLSALEKCVRFNNYIPWGGGGYAQLFFCWTGEDTDDERDPEWGRVTRLREVLGVEGMSTPVIEPNVAIFAPPPAPYLEGAGSAGSGAAV